MPLKIEPMTEQDYIRNGSEVKDGFESGLAWFNTSLTSPDIFGSESHFAAESRPVGVDHRRGYIHLCVPVMNYAIAGPKADMIKKILSKEDKLIDDVLACRICYDPHTKEYLSAEEVANASTMLWGAQIVKMWIDDFSIEQAIVSTFQRIMTEFRKAYKLPGEGVFRRAATGGFIAAGDWRFFPSTNDDYSDLAQYIGAKVFHNNQTRFSYLLNLQDHKERLYAMVTEYISVVPLGMRPDIDRRHDQLSYAYEGVISANKNLRMLLSGQSDPHAFAQGYLMLSNRVLNLMVEAPSYKQNQKSVLDKLGSKQGHIREHMLGKRVDYSGRSVITIDPTLSLRKVKIPKDMTPKLYRSHLFESMSNPIPSDWIGSDRNDKCNHRLKEMGILDEVPVVIGRQPTLHRPSMRSFKVELTDERSIRVNPLCVTGFNADFDGDQMWVRVPVSEGAVREVKELMNIENNLYYPKNGECSVMPRQEIIYGLNVCTRANMQAGPCIKTYSTHRELLDDLYNQDIKVYDTVSLNGYTECAGRVAFAGCLPKDIFQKLGMREITSKNIALYVESMLERDVESAIDGIDLMVEIGFRICYLYPPTLNLLDDNEITYSAEIEEFHSNMKEITSYYERGLEEQAAYDAAYDKEFSRVEDAVKDSIYGRVGPESGFVRLAESGARGSKGNLVQMYGYKGRIQKSARESFRAVIEHSYTEQLTPLEHFVTAYGGRQGLINKSLNTADTGYASRKMWHAASPYVITCNDCGTTEGIDIRKSDIAMFITSRTEIDDVFTKIITGRYEAKTNRLITKELAEQLCKESVVTIRSVLTCDNPCCKKCYGIDPATQRVATIGLPIGFIAAQSIGEPGTQLSMDSFKKGGVASKTGVTSAFDRLKTYIECASLAGRFDSYDPVAWKSGNIIERANPDGTKTVRIEGDRHSIKLPNEVVLRKEAVKGEGICMERGDYDMTELVEYAGIRAAQVYFIHTLYHIYKNECEISMKHFEVLAASMTLHMVIASDRTDLYPGQFHDTIQLKKGSLENTVYRTSMVGVKRVQPARTHALSRVLLERVREGLSSSLLLGLDDPLEYPLNRIMLGEWVEFGDIDEIIDERNVK